MTAHGRAGSIIEANRTDSSASGDEENTTILKRICDNSMYAMMVCALVSLALLIYEIATLIKIAIPPSYEVQCIPKSKNSSILLIVLSILPLILMASNLLISAIIRRNCFETIPLTAVLLIGINSIALLVFSIWLYGLVSPVWQGISVDVYEFVVLCAMMPLLPMQWQKIIRTNKFWTYLVVDERSEGQSEEVDQGLNCTEYCSCE